jgi:hypothetical protein
VSSEKRSRLWVAVAVVVASVPAGVAFARTGSSAATFDASVLPGPEGPPIENGTELAPAGAPAPGSSVDGIHCQGSEQVLFHIHARLTIFVDGRSRRVPYGIGIAPPRRVAGTPRGAFVVGGTCFAWLHTHAADGIVHIESPVQRTFTLGNFFDVWKQPLNATRVGPANGTVTALVDGKVWHGNPRSIPMHAHAQIQLDVGRPFVGPVHISNWYGL